MLFHHVLRRLDEDSAVYIRLRPTDEWQDPAPDRYRVVACPIPLNAHFCFVARDGARMCTVGSAHEHRDEQQGLGRGWCPAEIEP